MLLLTLIAALAQPPAAGPIELETFDGRRLVMSNYAERRGTLVLFLSAQCEATRAAADEIRRLNRDFRLQGVLLVGVFPNARESGDQIRRFAQRMGFVFPVYRDPEARAARRLGARVTPEAFLLDSNGYLIYRGALGPQLTEATAALIAARRPAGGETPASGTPIGSAGAAREPEDPYGSVWFSSELIFETIPGAPAHHASTLVEAANGDLLAAWYGGSYESADDQTLFLARRKKGECGWSAPQALIRNSLEPPGNAVLFRDGRDRVWLVWARMESTRPLRRGGGWSQCRLLARHSEDHGVSWSRDEEWADSFGWLPRNPPARLPDGALVLPLSGRGAWFSLRSADPARGWARSAVAYGGGQPAVALRPDGSLLALLRATPRILASHSRDGGASWSKPAPTQLRNPGSGIALARLRNGDLLVAFNDSETARTPLVIARSRDGGTSWERPLALESNPGEYSYPCIIQSADGRIHLTYTYRRYSIKHVEMSESWLERLERPN